MIDWAVLFCVVAFVLFVYISPSLFCKGVIGYHVDVNFVVLGHYEMQDRFLNSFFVFS